MNPRDVRINVPKATNFPSLFGKCWAPFQLHNIELFQLACPSSIHSETIN